MSILGSNMLAGAAGRARYQIERSLRFNSGDSAYLNRTPATLTNTTTNTFSAWVKRSGFANTLSLWAAGAGSSNNAAFYFDSSDRINVAQNPGSGTTVYRTSTQAFRDTSAWYHIVLVLDTNNSTAQNRIRIYVNNDEITTWTTNTTVSSGATFYWNSNSAVHAIGANYNSSALQYFPGYITEINFIDGQALTPSSFGEIDLETGAWIPKKYRGSFGTNGFYLDFADNSGVTATTLGKDSSGNSNNWTPNNFSVTAGTGNDSMEDTPTNNWCTLNPLNKGVDSITVDQGNLRYSTSGTDHLCVATFAIPSSGKWYWEYRKDSNGTNTMAGIICRPETADRSTWLGGQADGYSVYAQNGQKYNNGNGSTYMATPGTNSTITVAFDADNSELYVGADGNWANGSGSTNQTFANAHVAHQIPTDKTCYPAISVSSGNAFVNFGQRPFDHTPPAGYIALNAKNLPAPTIPNGTKHFNTVLFTGNGSTQSVTGVGFQPDWTWIKMRSDGSRGHAVFDSVRGGLERLDRSATQEGRTNEGNISFQPDGFNITSSHPTTNDSSDTAVAWNWLAGGAAVSNGDGSIPSEVSVNPEAGFSIVTYTGPGSTETVGHGLGVAPEMIIIKGRNNTDHWFMYNANIDNPTTNYMYWNLGNSQNSGANPWNGTAPTSSVFTIVNDGGVGSVHNGNTYVAYCFAEVKGYSKFGRYKGNSQQPDGTYIHTGFKPAFVELKRFDSGDFWLIMDNKRSPHNARDNFLKGESDTSEGDYNLTQGIDIYSNGFKLRDNDSAANGNNDDYIYMAFAEVPFKYANAC